jgi:hypothetical protein
MARKHDNTPSDQRLLALIAGFLEGLPRESRMQLGGAHRHLIGVRRALEDAGHHGSSGAENLKDFVERRMSAVAFAVLLDPPRPIDDPWVLDQATGLSEEVLRSRARLYKKQYGDLVDLSAAKAIGWLSLLELAKRMEKDEEIRNPLGLLRVIIEGDVGRVINASLHQAQPGAAAARTLAKKEAKRLLHEQLELDPLERRTLAMKLAREHLGRFYNFLDREGEESLDAVEDEGAGTSDQAIGHLFVEAGDGLVANRDRYTDIDRRAWARFKAAGLRGRDIDWRGECAPHTGSQRLRALFAKLCRDLKDWL